MTLRELIEEIQRVLEGTPAHEDDEGETCEANGALDEIDALIDRWKLMGKPL